MFTPRHAPLAPAAAALSLFLSACGSSGHDLKACTADAECGGSATCIQGACVADRPPAVAFTLPASGTTNRVLAVTATAADPDPGDAVKEVRWTVTSSDGCDADAEPGAAGQVELVFWCAGTYEVSAVATDGHGLSSAPARQVIAVSQAEGAPVVAPGPAVDVAHRCLGTPLRCRLDPGNGDARVPVSAVVTSPGTGPLTYAWKALPPPGADPGAVVSYSPGPTALDAAAWIETLGGPIAGEWRFRVRATAADGLIGQAVLPVRVGNREPVLQPAPYLVGHRFAGGHYLVNATLVPQLVDPDGDPIAVTATWQEAGADGCTTRLVATDPLAATLAIDCTDPRQLGAPASRGVLYRATDGNGGAMEGLVPVEVGNRPPVLQLVGQTGSASVRVEHSFGPCPDGAGDCYLAGGSVALELVDPDGDPVSAPAVESRVAAGLLSSFGEVATSGQVATFRFASRSTAPLEFRAADDSTWFSLAASGTDALGAPATLALEVRIGNRRPVVETFRPSVQATHRFDPAAQAYLAEATLSSFSDPDGDPLEASSSSGDAACGTVVMSGTDAQARCRLAFPGLSGPPPLASFATNHPMTLRVSDGWEVASAAGTVAIQNAMPTARPTDGTVQSCYCNCRPTTDGTGCIGTPTWAVDTANVPLRVDASEPDGDPVQVTVTPSTWVAAPVKTVLVGGASAMLVNPVLPASYTVTIDDGVSKVTTTSRVTGVTCSLQGQVCQP